VGSGVDPTTGYSRNNSQRYTQRELYIEIIFRSFLDWNYGKAVLKDPQGIKNKKMAKAKSKKVSEEHGGGVEEHKEVDPELIGGGTDPEDPSDNDPIEGTFLD